MKEVILEILVCVLVVATLFVPSRIRAFNNGGNNQWMIEIVSRCSRRCGTGHGHSYC